MQDRFNLYDWVFLILLLVLAAGARAAYLHAAVDDGRGPPAWQVQGSVPDKDRPKELDRLVYNWVENGEFKGPAPLAHGEEVTGHIAPAYSWLFSLVSRLEAEDDMIVRWIQAGLGTITVLLYYLFARRAFGSRRVAVVAGLLAAIYPFWIVSTAELHDGVLAAFALAVVLVLGTRGSQVGGVLTSLLFGLALAGLVMVRAAFLPFTLAALIWYLLSCRKQRVGWLCALLACLGYATGLNPWIVRDYQAFEEPVPVATSTFLHLWMGNNARSDGTELESGALKRSLTAERYEALLKEPDQARRYNMLAHDVLDAIKNDPKGACERRIQAAGAFFFGKDYKVLAHSVNPPGWIDHEEYWAQTVLIASLLLVFGLSFVGWRLSMSWRHQSRLAALAVFWVPLPYILSHAETLSGPRLPLDGVLICLAAYAVAGYERKKKS